MAAFCLQLISSRAMPSHDSSASLLLIFEPPPHTIVCLPIADGAKEPNHLQRPLEEQIPSFFFIQHTTCPILGILQHALHFLLHTLLHQYVDIDGTQVEE